MFCVGLRGLGPRGVVLFGACGCSVSCSGFAGFAQAFLWRDKRLELRLFRVYL